MTHASFKRVSAILRSMGGGADEPVRQQAMSKVANMLEADPGLVSAMAEMLEVSASGRSMEDRVNERVAGVSAEMARQAERATRAEAEVSRLSNLLHTAQTERNQATQQTQTARAEAEALRLQVAALTKQVEALHENPQPSAQGRYTTVQHHPDDTPLATKIPENHPESPRLNLWDDLQMWAESAVKLQNSDDSCAFAQLEVNKQEAILEYLNHIKGMPPHIDAILRTGSRVEHPKTGHMLSLEEAVMLYTQGELDHSATDLAELAQVLAEVNSSLAELSPTAKQWHDDAQFLVQQAFTDALRREKERKGNHTHGAQAYEEMAL